MGELGIVEVGGKRASGQGAMPPGPSLAGRGAVVTEDDAVAAVDNQVVCNRVIAFVNGPRVRSR